MGQAWSLFALSFVGLFSFLFWVFSLLLDDTLFISLLPRYCWAGLWPLLLLHVASLLLGCWRSRLECQCSRIRYCDCSRWGRMWEFLCFPFLMPCPHSRVSLWWNSQLLVWMVYNYLDPKTLKLKTLNHLDLKHWPQQFLMRGLGGASELFWLPVPWDEALS